LSNFADLLNKPYFHGFLSPLEAQRLLSDKPKVTFFFLREQRGGKEEKEETGGRSGRPNIFKPYENSGRKGRENEAGKRRRRGKREGVKRNAEVRG
jgi:hypothetical protein